ncbi:MAG: ATP-binding cassette domain-containing protein, partial [Eggerthellaceae bacterium]|nr:ATP-binding cassette domain-containing protein [Eggerthellaceae bacterium]
LSGGQRQRIALARVLIDDAPIVLLDEPTTGLDPSTEHEVVTTMLDALTGKTIIMATHHLQEIGQFDRVLFLKDGRLAFDGKPDQLSKPESWR